MPKVDPVKLKELRESQGLSQEELAKNAGLSKRAIQNMESGSKNPTPASLDAISKALHVRISEFKLRDGPKPGTEPKPLDGSITIIISDLGRFASKEDAIAHIARKCLLLLDDDDDLDFVDVKPETYRITFDVAQENVARLVNAFWAGEFNDVSVDRIIDGKTPEPDRLACIRAIVEASPMPMFLLDFLSGGFQSINDRLTSLLEREPQEFFEDDFSISHLFTLDSECSRWKKGVQDSNGLFVYTGEFFLGANGTRTTLPTILISCSVLHESDHYVFGVVENYHDEWLARCVLQERVMAYQDVLDRIDTGVHAINRDGRLIFMNRAERELLGVSEEWMNGRPHVSNLSPQDHSVKVARVNEKTKHGKNLTRGQHRPFARRDSSGKVSGIAPVNILDIEVSEPDVNCGFRNHEIVTLVLDERVPNDIAMIFEEFGPRNPILSEIGISTFIKIQSRFALEHTPKTPRDRIGDRPGEELVFVYGNQAFIRELNGLWEHEPSMIEVNELDDILGRSESELWPQHASQYSDADAIVIRDRTRGEQIEKHPAKAGETDVQVLKLPLFRIKENRFALTLSEGDTNNAEVVGVVGFYWDVRTAPREKQDLIRNRIRSLYQPWDILGGMKVPIVIKDNDLRFTYGNQEYIKDLNRLHVQDQRQLLRPVNSLYDIIGLKDTDLFPTKIAHKYESDDRNAIESNKPMTFRSEPHGRRLVTVTKSPVSLGSDKPGVQIVFWYEPGVRDVAVEWKKKAVPFLRIGTGEYPIERHQKWYLFDILLERFEEEVTFEEIMSVCDMKPKGSKKQNDGNVRNVKSQLNTELDRLRDLGHEVPFSIENVGRGYKMIFDLSAKSPPPLDSA